MIYSRELDAVRAAYRRYAPVYDLMFGRVFSAARLRSCRIVNEMRPKRILEVGVGTGLSLPFYDREIEVVGVDISAEMLGVARKRLLRHKAVNVTLHEMDAACIDLPSGSFDVVVASYVLSVVPDPRRVLNEMRRLCAPDGAIVICNHSLAEGKRASLPRWLMDPLSRKLGWRPDFSLFDELRAIDIEILQHHRAPPFGMFTLATCAP